MRASGGSLGSGSWRILYNREFGFRLLVPEGSVRPDMGEIRPVKLREASEAAVCEGDYQYVTRIAEFGPSGVTFTKPLVLLMEARDNEIVRASNFRQSFFVHSVILDAGRDFSA